MRVIIPPKFHQPSTAFQVNALLQELLFFMLENLKKNATIIFALDLQHAETNHLGPVFWEAKKKNLIPGPFYPFCMCLSKESRNSPVPSCNKALPLLIPSSRGLEKKSPLPPDTGGGGGRVGGVFYDSYNIKQDKLSVQQLASTIIIFVFLFSEGDGEQECSETLFYI